MSNDELKSAAPLILAIETATRAGGVAVARGDKVLASLAGDAAVSHSTNLIEMIREALQSANANLQDVEVFAVACGPGSFTGLRIGLATVKAFAAHLNKRVVGVSTLAAVAHGCGVKGEIVSLLPAGRGEAFTQRFSVDDDDLTAVDSAQHLAPAELLERYSGKATTFAGDGVEMIERLLPDGNIPRAWNLIREVPPLAPSIALLGLRGFRGGKLVAPEDLQAVYVRASDAEINERWLQQKLQPQAPS